LTAAGARPASSRVRAARAILLYVAGIVVLGSLFAPVLFWICQWTAQWLQQASLPGGDWLARQPFRRIYNRSILIVALAGLWPLLRALQLRSWREIGWARRPDAWRHVGLGITLGVASLLAAAGIAIMAGRRGLNPEPITAAVLAGVLLKLAFTATTVSLLEETFFRGAVQAVLQRALGLAAAVVLTSALYSAVHFLKPPGRVLVAAADLNWTSGFAWFGLIVSHSAKLEGALVGLVTLFLAGCILGWSVIRTGTLYLAIGLHAGWVLANEFFRWLGAGRIIEEMICWPLLLALFGIVDRLCRRTLQPLPA
jgi:membrane protease YdiL (CAAX protease family)